MSNAWEIAKEIVGKGFTLDSGSTKCAGYKVYREVDANGDVDFNTYVCDLNDRLELNLANGKTINLWIANNKATEPKYEITIITDDGINCVLKNATFKFIGTEYNKQFSFISIVDEFGMTNSYKTSNIVHFDFKLM